MACTVACHVPRGLWRRRFTVRGGRAVLHGGAAAGGRERRAGAEVQEACNGPASVRPREYCSAAGLNGLTPCHILPRDWAHPHATSAPGLDSPPCHISAQPHPNANRIGVARHAACVPARDAMCPYPRRNRFSRCMPDATCDCCSGASVCAQPADHVLPRVGPARARRPDARGSPTCARSHSRPFPLRRHALPRVRSGPSAHGGPRWRPQPPGSALARSLPTVLAVRSPTALARSLPRHWPILSPTALARCLPWYWPVASPTALAPAGCGGGNGEEGQGERAQVGMPWCASGNALAPKAISGVAGVAAAADRADHEDDELHPLALVLQVGAQTPTRRARAHGRRHCCGCARSAARHAAMPRGVQPAVPRRCHAAMPRGRSLWTLNYARHKERIIRLRKFIEAWRAPPIPNRARACMLVCTCACMCVCLCM